MTNNENLNYILELQENHDSYFVQLKDIYKIVFGDDRKDNYCHNELIMKLSQQFKQRRERERDEYLSRRSRRNTLNMGVC